MPLRADLTAPLCLTSVLFLTLSLVFGEPCCFSLCPCSSFSSNLFLLFVKAQFRCPLLCPLPDLIGSLSPVSKCTLWQWALHFALLLNGRNSITLTIFFHNYLLISWVLFFFNLYPILLLWLRSLSPTASLVSYKRP